MQWPLVLQLSSAVPQQLSYISGHEVVIVPD